MYGELRIPFCALAERVLRLRGLLAEVRPTWDGTTKEEGGAGHGAAGEVGGGHFVRI